MDILFAWTIAAPALLLLAVGLIPRDWANEHLDFMRRLAKTLTVVAAGLSVFVAVWLAFRGPIDIRLAVVPGLPALNFGVYFDDLAAIMLLLISMIGAVICRYAVRYLDGDREQGRFFCWMLFTLGAVLLLVTSRNLLQFATAWIVADLGLHQLLTHHRHRSWAIWAARKKLLISVLGNVVLIAALAVTYASLGSFDYADLFAKAVTLRKQSAPIPMLVSAIGSLFVLAAMTKSAQFPFHSWLPDTMEAPTPVSALMHAGIINAGGFLVIRLSPLLVLSPAALGLLAMLGAITALLGGVVMPSQTSVKRSLAFSTIAQMGFMMLQCGLGGFSAALLHIVAHSLYKAHAFLSSGSVLEQAARTQLTQARVRGGRAVLFTEILAVGAAAAILGLALACFGISLTEKPGGVVLGFVLLLALTNLLATFLATRLWNLSVLGIAAAVAVAFAYFASFEIIDSLLAATMSRQPLERSLLDRVVHVVAVASFVAIFVVQNFIQSFSHVGWVQVFYVHANNGFYLDIPFRRLTGWIYGQPAAVS
jgi:NAD(P)H-quinone oxidoreductase subunit 5